MGFRNKDFENLRYYKGKIRDLEAKVNTLSFRINELESKLNSKPSSTPTAPSNAELFYSDEISRRDSAGGLGGGLSESEIKDLITEWINNGELPISIHDHTDDTKGGDAFANKGAALQ